MIKRIALASCIALFLALAGCGPGNSLLDVEGTVDLDGKALAEGDIAFHPEDKKFGGEGGKIHDGKYRCKARPGKNRVEIRASREVPGTSVPSAAGPDAPAVAARVNVVPARYNDQSTLTAEVGPGKTSFRFDLQSR